MEKWDKRSRLPWLEKNIGKWLRAKSTEIVEAEN